MTRPAPLRLGLSPENFEVLEILADEADRSPDEYAEEGLTLVIWGARAVLNNELDGKPETGLLIVKDGTVQVGYNFSAILRQVAPVPQEPAEEIEVEDPFVNDERVPLDLDPDLLDDAESLCVELETPIGSFVSTAIDIRRIVWAARKNGQQALVETSLADEFFDLGGSLDPDPEDF